MEKSLDEIGVTTGTDKGSSHHDYLVWYEETLKLLRNEKFLMIEIGVGHGGSLAMWGEYFHNATIIGLEIHPEKPQPNKWPNTQVRFGDASRLEFLDDVIAEFGRPLIVLDDGSHFWHHQIETLRYLWPRVTPGGMFIMEDVSTSFPHFIPVFKGHSNISTYDYLNKLNRWVVGNRYMENEQPDDGFISNYWPTVRSIHFYRGTCIIHKRLKEAR